MPAMGPAGPYVPLLGVPYVTVDRPASVASSPSVTGSPLPPLVPGKGVKRSSRQTPLMLTPPSPAVGAYLASSPTPFSFNVTPSTAAERAARVIQAKKEAMLAAEQGQAATVILRKAVQQLHHHSPASPALSVFSVNTSQTMPVFTSASVPPPPSSAPTPAHFLSAPIDALSKYPSSDSASGTSSCFVGFD